MEERRDWNLGQYDGREVLSALRKEIVLADLDGAIYWSNVILTHGGKGSKRLLARQCWIIAAEVVDDPLAVVRAHAVFQMADQVAETDHLMHLVAILCDSVKWWESRRGRAVEDAWNRAIGDLKDPQRRREVPSYALDRHTRRGWEEFRRTGRWDDRFSGDDRGRQKTLHLWERDGQISASSPLEDRDPAFVDRWQRLLRLQAQHLPDPEPESMDEPPTLFDVERDR